LKTYRRIIRIEITISGRRRPLNSKKGGSLVLTVVRQTVVILGHAVRSSYCRLLETEGLK